MTCRNGRVRFRGSALVRSFGCEQLGRDGLFFETSGFQPRSLILQDCGHAKRNLQLTNSIGRASPDAVYFSQIVHVRLALYPRTGHLDFKFPRTDKRPSRFQTLPFKQKRKVIDVARAAKNSATALPMLVPPTQVGVEHRFPGRVIGNFVVDKNMNHNFSPLLSPRKGAPNQGKMQVRGSQRKGRPAVETLSNAKESLSAGKKLVGTARFELATPCTPSKCATRLRYVPIEPLSRMTTWGSTSKFYTSSRTRRNFASVTNAQ
jgi:hypothetical protein